MTNSASKLVLSVYVATAIALSPNALYAAETNIADYKSLSKLTLTSLYDSGQIMPNESMNPKGVYTLTEIENADPDNLPPNTITKYIINADKTVTPVYYQVNIQTTFGSGANSQTYGWVKNAKGNNTFIQNPSDPDNQIAVFYDNVNSFDRINNTAINTDTISGNATSKSGFTQGSVIYNNGTDVDSTKLGDVTAGFTNNQAASSTTANAAGGAIFNNLATIGNITGDFTGNSAVFTGRNINYNAYGGAIANTNGIIGNITGNSIGNYASGGSSNASGGSLYNTGTVGNINGAFIGNYAASSTKHAYGGAIYNGTNSAVIGDITGTFIGNYVYATVNSAVAQGGAIYNNSGAIGSINADFLGNYGYSGSNAYGGAIYNYYGSIKDVTGDYIGNYIYSTNKYAYGGAIYNEGGEIGDINANFTGNYAKSNYSDIKGGAIYNGGGSASIGNITGNFTDNKVISTKNIVTTQGGAIYNDRTTIGDITGNFINNSAQSDRGTTAGGAIANINTSTSASANMGNIKGNFIGNFVYSAYGSSLGGAIYNNALNSTIDAITADFADNYVQSTTNAYGGAIYTGGKNNIVDNITGNFTNNHIIVNAPSSSSSASYGGALYLTGGAINSIKGNFKNNSGVANMAAASGGAIGILNGSIGSIAGDFINNTVLSDADTFGGALYLASGKIGSITGNFEGNSATTRSRGSSYMAMGGALANNGIIGKISGDFTGNHAEAVIVAKGGAISNRGNAMNIVDSSFKNNYAIAANAKGGAIYASGSSVTNIIADKKDIILEGNYTASSSDGERTSNAVYLEDTATLNLNASGNGKIVFNDKIASTDNKSTININQIGTSIDDTAPTDNKLPVWVPNSGAIVLNNDMSSFSGNVNLYAGVINIGKDGKFFENAVLTTHDGSIINAANDNIESITLGGALTINGKLNIMADADLANASMDTISASNTIADAGKINVSKINLMSKADTAQVTINFTDASLKDAVIYTGDDVSYSPIYKYHVAFDADNGNFTFDQFTPSYSDSFNPAVLATPIAAQLGGYLNQLNTYEQAFNNVDMHMIKSAKTRQSVSSVSDAKSKGSGKTAQRAMRMAESSVDARNSVWIKPFAVFEDVELNKGPKVSNDSYGSLVGIDTGMAEYTNGFSAILSLYAGYQGSRQSYDDNNEITQNGGLLGFTGSFYKGGFYTSVTANIGGSIAEASTMYGKDDFTMLNAGIASKTGYNIEIGNFILQPNAQVSYSMVNTFDYTNNSNVEISSDPLSAVQVAPGLKAIVDLSKGWQAYISGAMVWNLLDESEVTAASVALPEMSVDSYAKYGVGIQKTMVNNFSAYGQVMMTSGGRQGIDGKLGISLAI